MVAQFGLGLHHHLHRNSFGNPRVDQLGWRFFAQQQPNRDDDRPTDDHRGCGRDLAFERQFLGTSLQASGQFVGARLSAGGVELDVHLARLLLLAQLGGALVPVVDLLGQALVHGGQRLVDQLLPAFPHVSQVARHQVFNGVGQYLRLEFLPG